MLRIETIGRLGRKAEIREREDGSKYLRFRLCARIRNGTDQQDVWLTVFTNAVALSEFLVQGKQVFVTGNLAAPQVYNGEAQLTVNAQHIELLASPLNTNGTNTDDSAQHTPAPTPAPAPAEPSLQDQIKALQEQLRALASAVPNSDPVPFD